MKLSSILKKTRTSLSMEHAAAFGEDREAVERRYREARTAYIEASQELSRFGIRYEKMVADVPDSIDLAGFPGTEREPNRPVLVTANELDSKR